MGSSKGNEEQQEKEVSTKEEELPRDAVPCQVTITSSVTLHPTPGPSFGLAPLLIMTHRWTNFRGAAQRAADPSDGSNF